MTHSKNKQINSLQVPDFFENLYSKLAVRAFNFGTVRLIYFHTAEFGSSEHSEEKVLYMKCTLCLGLVGAQYLSKLELPVISGWSR